MKIKSLALFQKKYVSSYLIRSSANTFVINIVGMIMVFILQIILTNTMGAKNFGVYNFTLTIIAFLALPIKMGFDTVVVKYVSIYKSMNKMGKVKGLLIRSNQIVFLNSFVCIVLFIIIWRLKIINIEEHLLISILIGLLVIPFICLTAIRQGVLQGFKKIGVSQLPEKILNPFLLIILMIIVSLSSSKVIKPDSAMFIYLIVYIITFYAGNYFIKDLHGKDLKGITPSYDTKEWITTSIPLMLVSGMYLIMGQSDIIMLGIMKGTTESGIYSIAVKVALIISFGINAVNLTARPLISEAYASKDFKKMQKVTSQSAYIGSTLAIIAFIFILLFRNYILNFFGEEFTQAKTALIVLSISFVLNAFFGQTGSIMMMTGQQKSLSTILILAATVNIVLNYFLIPIYGIAGAASATLITTFLWNLVTLYLVYKVHRINPSIFKRSFKFGE